MITDLAAEQVKRTGRAQAALDSGRFKIVAEGVDHWTVTNGDNAPYSVLYSGDDWICSCADFINRMQAGLRCKHIEGVRLWLAAVPPIRRQEANMNDMQLTLDEQLTVLSNWLVPEWAIKKDKRVAHGKPFVWHEYTRIMLDKVLSPAAWSFVGGPMKMLALANGDQVVYLPGRMSVRFADGSTVIRSDVGVGLVQSRIESPDLNDQATDVWETGYKSATTDAIKGCAADLGRCFRPMQDGAMADAVLHGRFTGAFPFPDGVRTQALQYQYLMTLVPAWAAKTDPAVAGGKPYVPHEYVVQALDTIFGPTQWSFEIGEVLIKELPNGELLAYAPGTLTVIFADGRLATRFDVGLAPIRRKKGAADLVATPSENYETALKAAVTDALKGCAGDLGCCFRPMLSEDMEAAVGKGFFDNEFKRLRPVASDALEMGKRALGRDEGNLVSAPVSHPAHATAMKLRLFGDGMPVKTDDPNECAAYEKYRAAHDQVAPLNVNALRVWAHLYSDGSPVADDARARQAFDDYVNEHAGSGPAAALTLRTWHQVKAHARQPVAAATSPA